MSAAFDKFIANIKLSDVKLLLLKKLWDSGNSYPRNWVPSSTLLKLSQQKYFDRRLRELRDAGGVDIETQYINGEHCWRLNSATIKQQINRTYLTNTQKQKLFDDAKNCCAVCGKTTEAGVRGLQADHKIPLTKGGGEEISNWQALCNECNVAKRRMCQDCELECVKCSWAFPEKTGKKLLLTIPVSLTKAPNIANLSDAEVTKLVISYLENYAKQA